MATMTLTIEDTADGKVKISCNQEVPGVSSRTGAQRALVEILTYAATLGPATVRAVRPDGSEESFEVPDITPEMRTPYASENTHASALVCQILELLRDSKLAPSLAVSILGSAYLLGGTSAGYSDDTIVTTLRMVAEATSTAERNAILARLLVNRENLS